MAFTSTIDTKENAGSLSYRSGTFANTSGSTGGNIDTGLKTVVSMQLTHTAAAVVASAPVINETFPLAGSAITIVTVADTNGRWEAWGRE